MSSKTYAIGDLHGRFDLLELALAEISRRGGGRIIILGDFIDRGPQSRQIIERLMAGPDDDSELIVLTGNHEDMMVRAFDSVAKIGHWNGNGGGTTLISYGGAEGDSCKNAMKLVPREHVEWLRSLPFLYLDRVGKRIFVHAFVDHKKDLDKQDRYYCLWECVFGYRNVGSWRGHHIVHGHVQHEDGPILLVDRTNLDVSAWNTGRAVVGVFDDGVSGGPVEVFEVRNGPLAQ